MPVVKQLEAGMYRGTPMARLYDKANSVWLTGWNIGGSHQSMKMSPPETTDIESPNRTDEGTYAAPVVKFSINEKLSPFVLEFDNPSKDMLAISLSAKIVEQSIASGTGVVVLRQAAGPGGYVFTGYDKISNTVVNRLNGVNAADWVTATAYVVGDYHVPTTPNAHFYECTVAGNSDASEPTQTTDGTTFTDGTVTWIDRGLIIAAATDFSVSNAEIGQLYMPEAGGSLVALEPLSIVLDHAAINKTVYRKDQEVNAYGQFQFYGRNLAKPQRIKLYSLWCHFKGTAEVDYAQSDNLVVRTIEVTPMEPDFELADLEIPANWITGDHSRIETTEG